MDVLSEVLRVIRLSGVVHLRAEFTRPFAIAASQGGLAMLLKLPSESLIAFHVVVDGGCLVSTEKIRPVPVECGDVIVFPRGASHFLSSDREVTPISMREIYTNPSAERVSLVQHGGGGERTNLVCGFLYSDHKFSPLFEALPELICIRRRDGSVEVESVNEHGQRVQRVDQQQEADWWHASLRYLASEAAASDPGNRAVLARLAESLIVQVLRWQFRYAERGGSGWLTGLQDPQIGRVLNLVHALPDRPWTVDELAKEAATSRAVLAKRFVELVGQSPIQYLAGWRMHLARDLLREGRLGIAEIASRVGYESEAAFNRAFRRLVGTPPATWREAAGNPASGQKTQPSAA